MDSARTSIAKRRILAARKEIPADLVLRGARVINVFVGEIQKKDVAIYDGVIVGVGSDFYGRKEVDLYDKWIVPGLIDGHFHIESSMLLPPELAAALLVHGTTTIISDPHEIANVLGLAGVRLMLDASRSIPF
ncbi:MAG: amidohydrolase family protein, partial [Thermodesulfobacteriota bacterium]|nr:amidohydrolase family protein [Thermodesulfobacteriota bacterium]